VAFAVRSLTLVTGVLYPLVVTGIAQLALRHSEQQHRRARRQAGWQCDRPAVQRPNILEPAVSNSADAVNAGASTGSNLGPTNPALADAVRRVETLGRRPERDAWCATSWQLGAASIRCVGPAAADYQVARVAQARGVDAAGRRSSPSILKADGWIPG
jgi:K+-transporting ATPase ATPase C chain